MTYYNERRETSMPMTLIDTIEISSFEQSFFLFFSPKKGK